MRPPIGIPRTPSEIACGLRESFEGYRHSATPATKGSTASRNEQTSDTLHLPLPMLYSFRTWPQFQSNLPNNLRVIAKNSMFNLENHIHPFRSESFRRSVFESSEQRNSKRSRKRLRFAGVAPTSAANHLNKWHTATLIIAGRITVAASTPLCRRTFPTSDQDFQLAPQPRSQFSGLF